MTRTASLAAVALAAGSLGLLAGGTASAAPSCAVTPVLGANLIANGGAEDNAGVVTGTGTATRVSTVVPNCWSTTGSALGTKQTSGNTSNNRLTPAAYTWASGQASAYPNAPIANQSDPAVGANLFYGGDFPYNANSTDTMTQTLDVSSLTTGTLPTYTLSGLLGGYYNQTDNVVVTATFQNAAAAALGSVSIGPVTATDRGNVSQLLARSATGTLPAGTTQVVVSAVFTMVGTGNNNGYADNLAFVLADPSAGTPGDGGPSADLPEVALPALLVAAGGAALAGGFALRRRRRA